MITIPKKVEYSIIFISYLAKKERETVSLMDVSKRLLLPYRFLGQLALALKEAGIVESKEGKSGGYCLKQGWSKKTLYDVLVALKVNKHLVTCLAQDKVCAREAKCSLRKVWQRVESSFVNELKLIKLSDI